MTGSPTLEQRLAVLEKEMADLKQLLPGADKRNWFDKVAGSFKDEPDFDEILRLGQGIRKADKFGQDLPASS